MDKTIFKQIHITSQRKIYQNLWPKIYQSIESTNYIGIQQYLINHHSQLLKILNQQGCIILSNMDIINPNEICSILNKIGLNRFEFNHNAGDKLVIGTQKFKNNSIQIYELNQGSQTQSIPFYHHLLQNQLFPQIVCLYCKNIPEYGNISILNTHQLYNLIHNKYPQFLNKLQSTGIRYTKIIHQNNSNSPIGRGWSNILKKNHLQIQQYFKLNGYSCQWKDNQCKVTSQVIKAILAPYGRKLFTNQIIAVFKGWIDDKNPPNQCIKFGDFGDIPAQIINDICQLAQSIKTTITWNKGDIMLLNNYMTAYSREPFIGKYRKIYTSFMKGQRQPWIQPTLTLESGQQMPMYGLGTWKIPKEQCQQVVYKAIKNKYRLLDCACDYGNEQQVGKGIKRAIQQKFIRREDLFVTSKLWNTYHRRQYVKMACKKSLKDLDLEYLDLYLIHFPISLKYVPFEQRYPPSWIYDPKSQKPYMLEDPIPIIETWRAMQQLVRQGLVHNIGISNFNISLIRNLLSEAEIKPSVLQVELHPYLTQKNLIKYCRDIGLQITGYSSLGALSYISFFPQTKDQIITKQPILQQIATKYNKTIPQIVLKWSIQQGIAIIPKTVREDKLIENINLNDFRLNEDQMKQIDTLNRDRRFNDPGHYCQLAFGTFFPIFD